MEVGRLVFKNVDHISYVLQKESIADSGAERRGVQEGWKVEGSCAVCRPHMSRSPIIVKRPPWRAFPLVVADEEEF